MRNEEPIVDVENLSKNYDEESKIKQGGLKTTCMRALNEKTCHVRRSKPSKLIEEIARNLYNNSYLCCVFVNQRQLVESS